jgi:hypothetical protein
VRFRRTKGVVFDAKTNAGNARFDAFFTTQNRTLSTHQKAPFQDRKCVEKRAGNGVKNRASRHDFCAKFDAKNALSDAHFNTVLRFELRVSNAQKRAFFDAFWDAFQACFARKNAHEKRRQKATKTAHERREFCARKEALFARFFARKNTPE